LNFLSAYLKVAVPDANEHLRFKSFKNKFADKLVAVSANSSENATVVALEENIMVPTRRAELLLIS
jgi:hypothetical protein